MKNPTGCRISERNLDVLTNDKATREAVISSLKQRAAMATADQILIFYFAGHGELLERGFALLPHDARSADYASTAITSSDLDAIFAPCAARGVLIILDCCGGAALAENAPNFVQKVGRHDFRILLSASRANQSSWETADGSLFTRHLLAVVEGREQVSAVPGEVYFNDLLRHLRNAVSEEIANARGQLMEQEPVFNGGYTEDPLIFLHTGETLNQIRVRIQRYSREYVMRRIRLTAASILGTLVLGVVIFWIILDQSYYIEASDTSISIYHGHPGLTGLGYPSLVWTSEIPRNHLKENSKLQLGKRVRFARGEPFAVVVERELSPPGRALWLLWSGKNEQARSVAQEELKQVSPDRPNDWSELTQLYAESSGSSDVARLEELAGHQNPSVVQAAIRALARLDPARALQALSSRGFVMPQAGIHLQALQLWNAPCNEALLKYLNAFAQAPSYSQFVRATIDTALKTKCAVDIDPLLGADTAYQAAVTLLLIRQGGQSPSNLAAELATDVSRIVQQIVAKQQVGLSDVWGTLSRMIEMAMALSERRCPLPATGDGASPLRRFRQLLDVVDNELSATALSYDRARLAGLISAGCSDIDVVLMPPTPASANDDATWSIGLRDRLGEQVVVARFGAQGTRVGGDILQLVELITASDQVGHLKILASAEIDGYWKSRLIRHLRALKIQPTGIEPFFARGEVEVQIEAYLWLASSDRAAALQAVLQRLSDPTASFLPNLLTLLVASPEDAARLANLAQGTTSDENRRAALITLFGTRDQVVDLLSSSSASIRAAAVDYLAFRDDLREIAELVRPRLILPTFFAASFARMIADRDAIRGEVGATPNWALPVRLKMMLDLRNDLSSGMRLWVEREERRRLDGAPSQ